MAEQTDLLILGGGTGGYVAKQFEPHKKRAKRHNC